MSHSYEQTLEIQLSCIFYYIIVKDLKEEEGVRGLERISLRCPNLLILVIGNKKKEKEIKVRSFIKKISIIIIFIVNDRISYEDAKIISELIPRCPKLRELYLIDIGLGDKGIAVMCEAVLKCPNIVVFCIGSIIL